MAWKSGAETESTLGGLKVAEAEIVAIMRVLVGVVGAVLPDCTICSDCDVNSTLLTMAFHLS